MSKRHGEDVLHVKVVLNGSAYVPCFCGEEFYGENLTLAEVNFRMHIRTETDREPKA